METHSLQLPTLGQAHCIGNAPASLGATLKHIHSTAYSRSMYTPCRWAPYANLQRMASSEKSHSKSVAAPLADLFLPLNDTLLASRMIAPFIVFCRDISFAGAGDPGGLVGALVTDDCEPGALRLACISVKADMVPAAWPTSRSASSACELWV